MHAGQHFQPFDFYLLRMPVLPYSKMLELHAYYANDLSGLKKEYQLLFSDTNMQEAIFLASPIVYSEILKWLNNKNYHKEEKLISSLYKYLTRMCTRCTPFGTFSGCSLGKISKEGKSCIDMSNASMVKVSTLDMECLSSFTDQLPFINDEFLNKTRFYPNSSLYPLGDTYRYYEYKAEDGKRKYFLSSISRNEFIDDIISKAERGTEFCELVELLMNSGSGIDEEEAKNYVTSLIQYQILISEYAVSLTGGDYLSRLINQIEKKQLFPSIVQQLKSVKDIVSYTTSAIEKHSSIKKCLNEIVPAIEIKETIHTDTFFNLPQNVINESVFNILLISFEKLTVVLNNRHSDRNSDLNKFKETFYKKYEEQWIPLSEALDAEWGIGYGVISGENTNFTPLIDDLIIPGKYYSSSTQWTPLNHFILDKFIECKQNEIVITDEDIEALNKENVNNNIQTGIYPNSFSILGSIIAHSSSDVDKGNWKFLLKSCGGTNAISLLARFGAKNKNIEQAIKVCTEYEIQNQPKDKIFAEIIHFPEGNVGNVLLRPSVFNYEIPFLGIPSVDEYFVIPIQDIYVAVRNNRIVLQSKSLNKEIIPRLSSAHNFTKGLPIYKFLCDIQQQQGSFSLSWDWDFLHEQPFLPRVSYKNIILKSARWFISKKEFEICCADRDASNALDSLIQKYSIPSMVLLIEGDNELFLDLSLDISKNILIGKLKKGNVVLHEFLFNKNGSFLSDGNQLYTNEIILPVRNIQPNTVPGHQLSPILSKRIQRSFALGSEWIYVKIYTGNKWADEILGLSIKRLIKKLEEKELIERWFFIRYRDPDNHIRLRIKKRNSVEGLQVIVREINQSLESYLNDNIISKVVYDTYQPEIEKYGIDTIDLCEEFFHQDSEFVLHAIYYYSLAQKTNEDRWLLGIKGVDNLFNDFELSIQEKTEFCHHRQLAFFREFNGDKSLSEQLNYKYRNSSKMIYETLSDSRKIFSEEIEILFIRRSISNRVVFSKIFDIFQNNENYPVNEEELLMNFAHLFINRIFIANQRLYELVIYHFLMKFYDSELARINTGALNYKDPILKSSKKNFLIKN